MTDFFTLKLLICLITSFSGSVTFALLFNVKSKHLVMGSICGLITYAVYYTVEFFTEMEFFAAFASAVFTALFSEIAARKKRAPVMVFLIPGIIPTVPGGALYRTMRHLIAYEWNLSLDAFLTTMKIALGIAGGIVAVPMIMGIIYDIIDKCKEKLSEKQKTTEK